MTAIKREMIRIGLFALMMTLGLLLAFPLKWAWNYVMPLFELPTITWLHAYCLTWISGMLFKKFDYHLTKEI